MKRSLTFAAVAVSAAILSVPTGVQAQYGVYSNYYSGYNPYGYSYGSGLYGNAYTYPDYGYGYGSYYRGYTPDGYGSLPIGTIESLGGYTYGDNPNAAVFNPYYEGDTDYDYKQYNWSNNYDGNSRSFRRHHDVHDRDAQFGGEYYQRMDLE